MGDRRTLAEDAAMRRWMIAVGVFFLVLGIGLLPWVNDARIGMVGLEVVYAGGDLTVDDPAYRYVLDWAGVFGTTLLALGGMLLVASREPGRNRLFVHLVIWHEVVAGVLSDAWFISRDYVPDAFYLGFIVVHLVVISTGIRALRRTPPSPSTARSPRMPLPGGELSHAGAEAPTEVG